MGETGRSLGTHLYEHQTKKSSAVFEHMQESKHEIDIGKNRSINQRRTIYQNRRIKEAVLIWQMEPPPPSTAVTGMNYPSPVN